jgi:hypothetical protein
MALPNLSEMKAMTLAAPDTYELEITGARQYITPNGNEAISLTCEITDADDILPITHSIWVPKRNPEAKDAEKQYQIDGSRYLNALKALGVSEEIFKGIEVDEYDDYFVGLSFRAGITLSPDGRFNNMGQIVND